MPVKALSQLEVDGIDYIVRRTRQYLEHPDVVAVDEHSPDVANHLSTVWGFVRTFCQQHPTRRVPTPSLAGKLSIASQTAADLLSHPDVVQIRFALPTSNVARELREVVRRMKDFRK
jgi:hypothetical protein